MGIRCHCPNGHKLNLKSHLAGERGICPECGTNFMIPGPKSDAPTKNQPTTSSSVAPPRQTTSETDDSIDLGRAPSIEPDRVTREPTFPQSPESLEGLGYGLEGLESSDSLPIIIQPEPNKIATIRTRSKRSARHAATFLLGIMALALIIILILLI